MSERSQKLRETSVTYLNFLFDSGLLPLKNSPQKEKLSVTAQDKNITKEN